MSARSTSSTAYSGTPLPRKLGLQPGTTLALVDAPVAAEGLLGPLPDSVRVPRSLPGHAGLVVCFVTYRALLALQLQQAAPGMRLAGITYELVGPVPLTPLTVEAEIVRPGRRFQLLEGRLVAGGRPAVLARAVALGGGEVALPAGAAWEGA